MSLPWVLVDASYLAYRALYSVGDLSLGDVPTGVLFGFLYQLRRVCLDRRVRSNRVAVFRDSRHSVRKKVYPDYKGGSRRERTEEEWEKIRSLKKQVDRLTLEILPEVGFPVYSQRGLESDDLLASAALSLSATKDPSRRGVMVTADSDLFQCITRQVHWFDPLRDLYYDPETFEEARGLHPSLWGRVKMIAGCHSDNVPGVEGVAEKTTVRFLRGELPPRHKSHGWITSEEGRARAEWNRGLVVLPHGDTKPVVLREPELRPEALFRWCEEYGLESILREKGTWTSYLRGGPFKTGRKRGELL